MFRNLFHLIRFKIIRTDPNLQKPCRCFLQFVTNVLLFCQHHLSTENQNKLLCESMINYCYRWEDLTGANESESQVQRQLANRSLYFTSHSNI